MVALPKSDWYDFIAWAEILDDVPVVIADWSDDDLRERMRVFVAGRT